MTIATPATSEYKSFADVATALQGRQASELRHHWQRQSRPSGDDPARQANGLNWQHVPYKGGGPMMQDAVGGHVPLVIGSVFVVKPHIDSGRVRALAVTTAKRSAAELPNVPALAEVGYGQFEAPAWWAVLAPAKTPPEIVARMNAEISKALQNPDTAEETGSAGHQPDWRRARDGARVYRNQGHRYLGQGRETIFYGGQGRLIRTSCPHEQQTHHRRARRLRTRRDRIRRLERRPGANPSSRRRTHSSDAPRGDALLQAPLPRQTRSC